MGTLNAWSPFLVALVLTSFPASAFGGRCDRLIATLGSPKTPSDGRFEVSITGKPKKYVPGETYQVRLQGSSTGGEEERENRYSFSGFMLTVDAAYDGDYLGPAPLRRNPVGNFSLYGDTLAKFDERCPHAVTHTSTIRKTIVEVQWTAPVANSGCVIFRALVIEQGDKWYADDGLLSQKLCEEIQSNIDQQAPVNEHCGACEEAKYEVTFEGLWSRNTHPKHFPPNVWLTRFSDVIGASHDVNYRFWEYNAMASPGLQELAERGATRLLESELKAQSEHIRTIIKARGISHPNVTGKTFAVFRVDRTNHLISLVSMLEPSPDWIVGVSGLELCLSNNSWAERVQLNLYPWDAGTDSGLSYLDPDRKTEPQEPIRRITESFPNDERSPFYDPDGKPMKPVARLSIARQRLYEKSCAGMGQGDGEREGCEVTPWGPWAPCSPPCGRHSSQLRQRSYVNPDESRDCGVSLTDRKPCYNVPPCTGVYMYGRDLSPVDDANCEVGDWGQWSSCTECSGVRTRQRKYKYQSYAKSCSAKYKDKDPLVENTECDGQSPGPGCRNVPDSEISQDCQLTEWTQFSPCSVSCGTGTQERTRRIEGSWETPREDTIQSGPCANALVRDRAECYQSSCELAPQDIPEMETRFESVSQIREPHHRDGSGIRMEGVRGRVVDCQLSHWSEWSPCDKTCGTGHRARSRDILETPYNGGQKCSQKLLERRRCRDLPPCIQNEEDCQMSHWSRWSECSASCGDYAFRQRSRIILREEQPGGAPCGPRTETQKCFSFPCPIQP